MVVVAVIVGCQSVTRPPRFSGESDPRFQVTGVRTWYLIENALTPGHESMEVSVAGPLRGVKTVRVWIDGAPAGQLTKEEDVFSGSVGLADLPAGQYQALFAFDDESEAFARVEFYRSHPLYVLVSNDWDDPDHDDEILRRQEWLHETHPELKITHLVGPYTFTDREVSEERRDELVSWLLAAQDDHGDEIGLHIHPYCSFVEDAGVSCRHRPSLKYADDDPTGYTVSCTAYTEQEFAQLLRHADELFLQRGLGKPTSFRAGGWTADLSVLRALAATGYLVDASANNWARMEEWEDREDAILYWWNQEHWSTIDDTSQPYYPSMHDIQSSDPPHLSVLEVPDNGSLVDYVTGDEMVAIVRANWAGGALASPRQVSIGYHPSTLDADYAERLHVALTHTDRYLASRDRGPIAYETLTSMTQVFPPTSAER